MPAELRGRERAGEADVRKVETEEEEWAGEGQSEEKAEEARETEEESSRPGATTGGGSRR